MEDSQGAVWQERNWRISDLGNIHLNTKFPSSKFIYKFIIQYLRNLLKVTLYGYLIHYQHKKSPKIILPPELVEEGGTDGDGWSRKRKAFENTNSNNLSKPLFYNCNPLVLMAADLHVGRWRVEPNYTFLLRPSSIGSESSLGKSDSIKEKIMTAYHRKLCWRLQKAVTALR